MSEIEIGIIGGSGLYDIKDFEYIDDYFPDTPYGKPSDKITTGMIKGVRVAFLARHGRNHSLLPLEVPYRANIFALRKLGVKYLLSFSAVGSLSEAIAPLDMVLPDQYIDFTRGRVGTFFGNGVVAHVSMARPTCELLRQLVDKAIRLADPTIRLHQGGTYLCIEGPQFSTIAESYYYRSLGANVIGMTNMPEAKLAREAQMAYASVAMVTDYDCWHPQEDHVTAETAIANLTQNANRAQEIILQVARLLAVEKPVSLAHSALDQALVTPRKRVSGEMSDVLDVLLGD